MSMYKGHKLDASFCNILLTNVTIWRKLHHAVLTMQAKRKYLEILQEKQNLEADRAELQQKYAQKAQQARKLQDMFQMVRASICGDALKACACCTLYDKNTSCEVWA